MQFATPQLRLLRTVSCARYCEVNLAFSIALGTVIRLHPLIKLKHSVRSELPKRWHRRWFTRAATACIYIDGP